MPLRDLHVLYISGRNTHEDRASPPRSPPTATRYSKREYAHALLYEPEAKAT